MVDFKVGDKVNIRTDEHLSRCQWWPKGQVTGTVERLFKNGKVAVAVDGIWNTSDDHKATMHFKPEDLSPIAEPDTPPAPAAAPRTVGRRDSSTLYSPRTFAECAGAWPVSHQVWKHACGALFSVQVVRGEVQGAVQVPAWVEVPDRGVSLEDLVRVLDYRGDEQFARAYGLQGDMDSLELHAVFNWDPGAERAARFAF